MCISCELKHVPGHGRAFESPQAANLAFAIISLGKQYSQAEDKKQHGHENNDDASTDKSTMSDEDNPDKD